MVVAAAATPERSAPGEYDSEYLDAKLKGWAALEAQAEHVRSPSAYEIARPAPTRGRFHNGSAAEIMADIERALCQLHRAGLGWRVMELRKEGLGLGAIARIVRTRTADVCQAHKAALAEMVEFLNGTIESPHGPDPQPVGHARSYGVNRL